jgi:hypothetical protein
MPDFRWNVGQVWRERLCGREALGEERRRGKEREARHLCRLHPGHCVTAS